MIKYKYGEFSEKQLSDATYDLRKHIYFLLLLVDKNTKEQYEGIDVDQAFGDLFRKLSGMNELLSYPKELVTVNALLEAAIMEYHNPKFQWGVYRKLILDAGNEVIKVKGV